MTLAAAPLCESGLRELESKQQCNADQPAPNASNASEPGSSTVAISFVMVTNPSSDSSPESRICLANTFKYEPAPAAVSATQLLVVFCSDGKLRAIGSRS